MLQVLSICAQKSTYPYQTVSDEEAIEYLYEPELFTVDQSKTAKGFWVFMNKEKDIAQAPLVIFVHGYGGYNPMIYGKWIKHLVRKGHVVIYPRYQRNIVFPSANKFAKNAAVGIINALDYLKAGYDYEGPGEAYYVGHSYGGTIISDYMVNYHKYEVPRPKVAMLCAPGTSSLNGGRLNSYTEIDSTLRLLIVEEGNDWVVGNEFSRKVFREAPEEMDKALIVNFSQALPSGYFDAHHNVCYSLDYSLDTKLRNYTTNRALDVGRTDELDYNFYWRLFDLLCLEDKEAFSSIFEERRFPVTKDDSEGLNARYIFHQKEQLTAPEE